MKRQPTQDEWLAGGGALAWVIAFFLPWYSVDLGAFGNVTGSGSNAGGVRWLFWFLAVAMVALIGARLAGVAIPQLPMPVGRLLLIAGGVLTVFTVLFAFAIKPDGGIVNVGPSWGVFVAIVAAAVATFGAFRLDGSTPAPSASDAAGAA